MFASDGTQLTSFSTAKLWPIYLMIGNESKDWRSKSIRFSVRVWYNLVLLIISSHTEVENKALFGRIIGCQSGVEVSVADALPLRLAPHEQPI